MNKFLFSGQRRPGHHRRRRNPEEPGMTHRDRTGKYPRTALPGERRARLGGTPGYGDGAQETEQSGHRQRPDELGVAGHIGAHLSERRTHSGEEADGALSETSGLVDPLFRPPSNVRARPKRGLCASGSPSKGVDAVIASSWCPIRRSYPPAPEPASELRRPGRRSSSTTRYAVPGGHRLFQARRTRWAARPEGTPPSSSLP